MKNLLRHWKIFYLAATILYLGWIIHVGEVEFYRINSQYRIIIAKLDPENIRSRALQELTEECIENAGANRKLIEDDCSALPPPLVRTREKEVTRQLALAKKRGLTKVILFYSGFTVIFLVGPPLFLYLLIIGVIRIYKSIKFVREEK